MQEHAAAGAVFVDPTGRRHRLVMRTFWVLGALGTAYLALVVLSLLLPPSLSRLSVPGLGPVLPGPGAAVLGAAEGEADAPEVLLERTPTPRAAASPSSSPSRLRTAPPRPTPSAVPTGPVVPSPSPVATRAAGRPTGGPTAAPTRRASTAPSVPPGQAERSPRPRPSKGPR